MNSPTRVPVLPPAFGSALSHDYSRSTSVEKGGGGAGSTHSFSNATADGGEVTYYNVQTPPSRTSNQSNDAHSNSLQGQGPAGQGQGQGRSGGRLPRTHTPSANNITLDSSSTSSSSSSTTSSDSDDSLEDVGGAMGQLAMVPRHPPPFLHPGEVVGS
ncbi:uncharacterized protein LOC143300820 [Babylonia areolata]|uniref:uncharacterized protein LOC143300820 n=1 Tax=Babylonia areolata TaxID=304850 RepID=UPI003FD3310F